MIKKANSTQVIQCSQVIAYNHAWVITKFGLVDAITSQILYPSGNYTRNESWTLDLENQGIIAGNKFYVKAIVEGSDSISDVMIQYVPGSNITVKFELTGTAMETTLKYIGVVGNATNGSLADNYEHNINKCKNTGSTPIIPCFEISAYNDSWTVTKWQIINSLTATVVYTSEPRMRGESWEFVLEKLSVVDGTEFYLKAAVEAGSDSKSTVILKYSNSSNEMAIFTLTGTTFDTALYYKGTMIVS